MEILSLVGTSLLAVSRDIKANSDVVAVAHPPSFVINDHLVKGIVFAEDFRRFFLFHFLSLSLRRRRRGSGSGAQGVRTHGRHHAGAPQRRRRRRRCRQSRRRFASSGAARSARSTFWAIFGGAGGSGVIGVTGAARWMTEVARVSGNGVAATYAGASRTLNGEEEGLRP